MIDRHETKVQLLRETAWLSDLVMPVVRNKKNGRYYVVHDEGTEVTNNANTHVIVYAPLPHKFNSPVYVRSVEEFVEKFEIVTPEEFNGYPAGPGE